MRQDHSYIIANPLHIYCLFLLQLVDEQEFNNQLIATSLDFSNQYITIKNNPLADGIELAVAERALLDWQGTVSDTVMQNSILQLRYSYLRILCKIHHPAD